METLASPGRLTPFFLSPYHSEAVGCSLPVPQVDWRSTLAELPGRELFPITAEINARGRISIGGCDLPDLVSEFGSPLYIYDEATIRAMCRRFIGAFNDAYPYGHVAYSSKAFLSPALVRILDEEGMGMDVVTGGELAVARTGGFPPVRLNFHGNNKARRELEEALDYGIGAVTVDSFQEIDLLDEIAGQRNIRQQVLLRVSPSIDAHTHRLTTTGILDTKFGFSIETGHAEEAVSHALRATNLDMAGIHFHLGSPIYELEPYTEAIPYVMAFCARMRDEHGLHLKAFSPGGGFAIGYTADRTPPTIDAYARAIAEAVRAGCDAHGFDEPKLIVEPGRAIVGRAGVAVYTVGAIKEIPDLRTYVSVDGGMGDNIRPALYGSAYQAYCANRPLEERRNGYRIAGKYCESGDILVDDAALPEPRPGDLLAVPASGAYNIPMASNYNMMLRPAVVLVRDGRPRLIRRRETYDDLLATSNL